MKNQPKKEKRLEDEKKKIEAAIEGLMDATKTFAEMRIPISTVMVMVRQTYAAISLLSILKNGLERK